VPSSRLFGAGSPSIAWNIDLPMSQIAFPPRPIDAVRAAYRRGAGLVAGATLVWSSAGLLSRWLQTDPWTTLFWRSVFAALGLLGYLTWRDGRNVWRGFRRLGGVGLAMAVCFAASMICFINALTLTTVAAVLVFQAAAPLFAAALAWAFLNERVGGMKLVAILVTLAGVVFMVSGSQETGSLWGNLLSAVMGICFAATIVLARAEPDVPTTEATCVAVVLVGLVSLPFAQLAVSGPDLALLALFGVGQMAVALVMFTTGVRLIPSADAGLISVLESVLGPLWVWAAFGEDPGRNTLIGGAVVIGAVIVAARAERA
jgi:drug/metabolite transporter (DMT)-like permease